MVEYSEMPADFAEKDASGELKFDAANVVLHYYASNSREMLRRNRCAGVRTRVPRREEEDSALGPGGDPETQVAPKSPNGIKLEAFIFDAYAREGPRGVLRGVREEDFAPVKNAEGSGKDSPDTARKLVSDLHARWIERAGGRRGRRRNRAHRSRRTRRARERGWSACAGGERSREARADKRESDEGESGQRLAEDDEGAQDAKKQKP